MCMDEPRAGDVDDALSIFGNKAAVRNWVQRRLQPVMYSAALTFAALLMTAAVHAEDHDHVYCTYTYFDQDGDPVSRVFFSAVFLGNWSKNYRYLKWEYEYSQYISEKHDVFELGGNAVCLKDDHSGETFSDLNGSVRSYRSRDYEVILTRWAPEEVTQNFTRRPLSDFNITVSSSPSDIKICVRDHECEDGDQVRISVNGQTLFSSEIMNDWYCQSTRISEGHNRIELYAINGSGRKGNCSYTDVNTGEIRVLGLNTETQTWEHRGEAGSSASIFVTVR